MNEVIIAIQTALSVYVLYLLLTKKEDRKIICSYFLISVYFLLMKLEIIAFPEWTILNYWSWWILNSSIHLFIIYYVNKKNGEINNGSTSEK